MASEEARKELQTNQDRLRQEDHRNRELESYDLQHKSPEEQLQQLQQRVREMEETNQQRFREMEGTIRELQERYKEEQEERKKAEEVSNKLRSRLQEAEGPSTPENQEILASDGRLSIASSVFRDQLLTDIF